MYDINLLVCDAILAQEYIVHNLFLSARPLLDLRWKQEDIDIDIDIIQT